MEYSVIVEHDHPYFNGLKKRHTTIEHAQGQSFDMAYILNTPPEGVTPSGEQVLLIHGYLAPGGLWRGIAEDLASLGHTVLSYDHPGCGSSTFPTGVSRFTTTSFADHAYQLMDNVWGSLEAPGSAGPVHVVGQSMGSMIAQELAFRLATEEPHRLKSLTLMASHAGGITNKSPPWIGLRSVFRGMCLPDTTTPEERAIKTTLPMMFSENYQKTVLDVETGQTGKDWALSFLVADITAHPPPSGATVKAHMLATLTHSVSKGRLHVIRDALQGKALCVHGDDDQMVRVSNAPYLAKHLGARLIIFKGIGHGLAYSRREENVEAIQKLIMSTVVTPQAVAEGLPAAAAAAALADTETNNSTPLLSSSS